LHDNPTIAENYPLGNILGLSGDSNWVIKTNRSLGGRSRT